MSDSGNQRTESRFSSAVPRTICSLATTATILLAAFLTPGAVTSQHPEKKKTVEKRDHQNETVRLHSDLVIVNATVSDSSGQFVHGLDAANFSILEDGVPQQIDSFEAEESSFAAAILVDMSGSMEFKFGLVRGAAAAFMEGIRENDQVALYGFNNKVRLFQDFTNSRYITDYIWDAEARDSTRLYDCMDEAIDALAKRPEKRRAILMISDGWDTNSQKATMDSVIKKSHAAGVAIYSVDLIEDRMLSGASSYVASLRRGRSEMQDFANQTGGRYVPAPDGDKLEESFNGIIDELRNQFTLTYYSTNDRRDGRWRKLSVSVSKPELTVRTRRGYFAPKR